ncbi:MAG: hypothetical protein IKL24_04855 [Clostridia bacterium]|nr:hypothetical protein [Clostridia bacterium]
MIGFKNEKAGERGSDVTKTGSAFNGISVSELPDGSSNIVAIDTVSPTPFKEYDNNAKSLEIADVFVVDPNPDTALKPKNNIVLTLIPLLAIRI